MANDRIGTRSNELMIRVQLGIQAEMPVEVPHNRSQHKAKHNRDSGTSMIMPTRRKSVMTAF